MRGGGALASEPRWAYALVLVAYAYQGLVAGFGLTALPNHLAAQGVGVAEIGLHAATVGLPWVLQPLWGPVVDRFGGLRMGRRRPWLILALLASVLALSRLLALGEAAPALLPAFSAALLWHAAAASLADTATDALVIDRVPADRLGRAGAVTRVGFVGGGAVGAAGFAWALPAIGTAGSVLVLMAAGVLAAGLALLVRERAGDDRLSLRRRPRGEREGGTETLAALLARLAAQLARRETVALLAFCFALDFAAAAFRVPLAVALVREGGWSAEGLSSLQAGLGLAAGTAGALLVGLWADRAGPGRALAALLAVCALSHAGAGLALLGPSPGWAVGPGALALSTVVPALVFVALAPAVMRASAGPAAATRFALFMAALNLGDVAGAASAGAVSGLLGLPATGLAAGLLFALGALVAARDALPGLSPAPPVPARAGSA